MPDGILGGTGFDWGGLDEQLQDADWGGGTERPDPEPISLEPESEPGEHVQPDAAGEPYTEPDATAVGGATRRPRGAAAYERKIRGLFATAIKATAQHPATVPDSAALILYSPKVAQTVGELAATDPRIARGIDMLTEGTENPYLSAALALAPLAFQLARNHEPVLEPKTRGFRIPFLMRQPFRLPIKLGIRLGALRNMTHEPSSIAEHVFGNAQVRAAFERQDVKIAWRGRR